MPDPDRSNPARTSRRLSLFSDRGFAGLFPNVLLFSVYGFALSLLLGRGTYEIALYLAAAAIAGSLAANPGTIRLERQSVALLGFGGIFLVQGIIAAQNPIAGDFHLALVWALLMATAVSLMPDRFGGPFGPTHAKAAAGLLLLFVVAQVLAYHLHLKRAGLFSNIHYLALYAAVTLPVLYFFAVTAETKIRWVFISALAGDFWLLLQTQSRPGFLALLAGALAVVPFLSRRSRRTAAMMILFAPALLYLTGWFGFAARIDDLIVNFASEERPVIWRETWVMLSKNSVWEWGFGHGLGQFHRDYQPHSSYHYKEDYSSPHNYVLDILYSHGLTGLCLFLAGFGLFYGKIAAATLGSRPSSRRMLGIVLISVTTVDLVHGFLTLPFFSRHNLFPLSLILGAGLRYARQSPRND